VVDVAGIFVGGESRRMGGQPKGLLVAPSGETIVERWSRMFVALRVPIVLVGNREAYAPLGIEIIEDDPPHIGPLGGLIALLKRARGGRAIAVACDMPFVSEGLLEKLATHPSRACALAPRRADIWEPLFARYEGPLPLEVAKAHAGAGRRSLFGVLETLDAEALDLGHHELAELRDWDEMDDISSREGTKMRA
jgi:molybdopterin-guanine dinucleotide biosynthesis protein A